MAQRRLRALQVEVTSRCTRCCAVCPRSALAGRWLDGDLSEDHWHLLRPDLKLAEHLHLQGWGEPLLHPRLEIMVADGQAAGCRVGLTSNGDLLRDATSWIVAAPLDVLAVSVAGGDESNRRLRGGALTCEILDAVAEVARRRRSRRQPMLHVSFLLTRDNATELEAVVRAAAEAGADAVFVNHLDCTPTAELSELAAFSDGRVAGSVGGELELAAAAARSSGIEIRLPELEPQEMLTCALDPRRVVSVRSDGQVAPCVMLNLPAAGRVPRCTVDGGFEVEAPVLGHLDSASLADVLDGDAYRSFVRPFERRMAADAHYREWGLTASGWGVVGLADLDRAYGELERSLADNPFPSACAGCPKKDGW